MKHFGVTGCRVVVVGTEPSCLSLDPLKLNNVLLEIWVPSRGTGIFQLRTYYSFIGSCLNALWTISKVPFKNTQYLTCFRGNGFNVFGPFKPLFIITPRYEIDSICSRSTPQKRINFVVVLS